MSLIIYQAEFGPWCTGTLPVAESLKRNIRNAAPKGRKWQPLMGYIGGKARRTAGRTVTGQRKKELFGRKPEERPCYVSLHLKEMSTNQDSGKCLRACLIPLFSIPLAAKSLFLKSFPFGVPLEEPRVRILTEVVYWRQGDKENRVERENRLLESKAKPGNNSPLWGQGAGSLYLLPSPCPISAPSPISAGHWREGSLQPTFTGAVWGKGYSS